MTRHVSAIWTQAYLAETRQVGHVREALAAVLEGCPVADDCVLLGSELASNAVLHSRSGVPGGMFTICAQVLRGDHVRLEVEDDGGLWVPRASDGRAHGLDIVQGLAGAGNWGVEGDESGRTVWVRLDCPRRGGRGGPDRCVVAGEPLPSGRLCGKPAVCGMSGRLAGEERRRAPGTQEKIREGGLLI